MKMRIVVDRSVRVGERSAMNRVEVEAESDAELVQHVVHELFPPKQPEPVGYLDFAGQRFPLYGCHGCQAGCCPSIAIHE